MALPSGDAATQPPQNAAMPDPTRPDVEPDVAGDATLTVIRPRRGWQAVDFGELYRYRELLYFLIWRDIKVRYKQTALGALWAVLQPVLTMVIFSVIFGRVVKMPSDGVPYPIFVFAGLLPWTYVQNAVGISSLSLVSQSALLTKIYFPRLFMPAASVGAGLLDLLLSFGVYGVLMLYYGLLPGKSVLLLPVLLILSVITALGVGLLLAGWTVSYRDFKLIVPFMTRMWLFLSPVIYPVSLFGPEYRWILALNPMTGIIDSFRSVLLDKPIDWTTLGISSLVAVALFVLGLYNFRRTERRFADVA